MNRDKNNYLFYAKTSDAYHIKILCELLSNNIKQGCFRLDDDGIHLCSMDSNKKILIDIFLDKDKFVSFKNLIGRKHLGFNLSHLFKMLKSIKKKDSLHLFIKADDEFKFGLKVLPKENTRTSTSYITIQRVQELEIEKPDSSKYLNKVTINSNEFSKMLKDINSISNITKIVIYDELISFKCSIDGILDKEIEFGDSDIYEPTVVLYNQTFYTEQLFRLSKISGLSNKLNIYAGTPLKLKTDIGCIGTLSLYIKSNEEIEKEYNCQTYNAKI